MPTVTSLTTKQIEKIQIDEGVVFLDYGVDGKERKLAPTRGGGEFSATVAIRDIEFDGRSGKTQGTQVIEEQEAVLKITSLCMSQDELKLAIPDCRVVGGAIKNPKCGVISDAAYLTNITMFARTLDKKYKKITIHHPMSENGLSLKATPKSEGELALEFYAHYTTDDLDGDLWEIDDVDSIENSTEEGQ